MRSCILIISAFAALAHCIEYEDLDQKKRGFTKGSSTNTIPTGAQKQDYTYSVYSQNPSSQSSQPASSSSYQQVPNSFYPNQGSSQYYSSSGTEAPLTYSAPQPSHVQPQSAQFAPINFVPNPGYQAKYQIVPSKQGLQIAIVQPPYNFQAQPALHYPQTLFSHTPANVNHLGIPGFQNLLGNSYLGHPSSMFLFPQPHQLYSNLLYNSHHPANAHSPLSNQAKYNVQFSPAVQSDYDTVQSQTTPKEENEVTSSSDYSYSADSNPIYKNTYSSRNNYVKLT